MARVRGSSGGCHIPEALVDYLVRYRRQQFDDVRLRELISFFESCISAAAAD